MSWSRILFCAALASCATPQMTRPALPFAAPHGPLVIAHRGGSLEAPENTLEAFKRALELGVDWLELDVHLAADGQLVVIHDFSLERTTDGVGHVGDSSAADLQAHFAGAPEASAGQKKYLEMLSVAEPNFADKFSGARIPTLAEVLALPDARLMIELKVADEDEQEKFGDTDIRALASALVAAVDKADARERVIIGSFSTDALWAVHDLEPSLPLIGIADTDTGLDAMLALPVSVLGVRMDYLATALKKAPPRVAVWTWTMYSPQMVEMAYQQGAHGIIADIPAAAMAHLRKPPELYIESEAAIDSTADSKPAKNKD